MLKHHTRVSDNLVVHVALRAVSVVILLISGPLVVEPQF